MQESVKKIVLKKNIYQDNEKVLIQNPIIRKYVNRKDTYLVNYKNYNMSAREEARCLAEGFVIICIFAYFFYRSILAVFFLLPLLYFYRKEKEKVIARKKKERLELQFKEVMLSVRNFLQAGYSMENAFIGSLEDMKGLYGPGGEIVKEIERIKYGIRNGITLEELLNDLGERCGGEVEKFTNIYGIASKTGGKWQEVLEKTISVISEKIEIKQEIEVVIHEKEMESKIMCVIPFFILFYMDLTSKDYFQVLYHNVIGIFIMTLCMAVYLYAYCLIQKIMAGGII